ncbi:MAG: DUF6382 domain-containing protein, partial [Lachnospiraceae bacterium]|nr:DUF6382 domain-containing protein [Lachnospiraceae bacterium]
MVWKNEDLYNGFDLHMIQENKIKGLLPLEVIVADGVEQYWYDISGYQALDDVIKGRNVGINELRNVLLCLQRTIDKCEKYLLSEDAISLSPEEIFVSADFQDIVFCYKPFAKGDIQESIITFFEYYLTVMNHSETEPMRKCYEAYEVCRKENFTVRELISRLECRNSIECNNINEATWNSESRAETKGYTEE